MAADDCDLSALRDQCTRFLHGHGPVRGTARQVGCGVPAQRHDGSASSRLGTTLRRSATGRRAGAASAHTCLATRLPRMPQYLDHARAIAAALREVQEVRVIPDPPQTPMMHLLLDTTQERFAAAARTLATERGIWTWPSAVPTADPGTQRVELAVGDATSALSPVEVAGVVAALTAE